MTHTYAVLFVSRSAYNEIACKLRGAGYDYVFTEGTGKEEIDMHGIGISPDPEEIDSEDHKQRHKELHRALDELCADWINHTGGRPSAGTVLELMRWSARQMDAPTEQEGQ